MYTTHRIIPDSPGTPAPPQRPPVARRASESGGGSENHLKVPCLYWSRGNEMLRVRAAKDPIYTS